MAPAPHPPTPPTAGRPRVPPALRRAATLGLPAGVSLAVHAGLLAGVFFVTIAVLPAADEERLPLGEVTIAAPAWAPAPPAMPADPPASGLARAAGAAAAAPSLDAPPPELPSLAGAGGALPSLARTGEGRGAPTLASEEAGRTASAAFGGLRSRAAGSIVYAVDTSGPMATSLSMVVEHLRGSLRRLSPTQRFAVVLFAEREGDQGTRSFPPEGLLRATPANIARAERFLDEAVPGGRSNPQAGLREALERRPELAFVLTRSIERSGPNAQWGSGREAILAELEELNPRRRGLLGGGGGRRATVIKAIQFIDEDPTGILRAIAAEHGDDPATSYRILTLEELGAAAGPEETGPALRPTPPAAERLLGELAARLARVREEGRTVLLGLPSEAQRAAVLEEAAAVLAALEDPALAGLTDDARPALLRARASVLAAAANDEAGERASLGQAAAGAVEGLVLMDAAADFRRRLDAAAGLLIAGRAGDSSSGDQGWAEGWAALLALLGERRDLAPRPEDAGEAALLALRYAPDAASWQAARERAGAVLREVGLAAAPAWRGLTGEASAANRLLPPAERLAPLAALDADAGLMPNPEVRRRWVLGKLALAVTDSVDAAEGPPLAAMAEALERMEAGDEPGALELLAAAERSAAEAGDQAIAADAAWERAAALLRAGSNAEAGEILAAIAERYPRSERTPEALRRAVRLTEGERRDELLALAVERLPRDPDANLWRLMLARRTAGLGEDRAALDLDAALALLEGVDAAGLGPELRGHAGDLAVGVAARALEGERVPAVNVLERALALAERFEAPTERAGALRAVLAERVLADDPAEALRLLESASVPESARPAAALARARALLALGRTEEGFAVLRSLTAGMPEPASDLAWHAWTLLLETVAAEGDEAERAAARTHLLRLRTLDPDLGGAPWNERLNRLP